MYEKKLWKSMKKYEEVWKSMKWICWSETMNWTLARIWVRGSIWIDVWNDSMNFLLEIRSSYFFILFHTFSVLYIVWKCMRMYEKVWKQDLLRPPPNKSIIYWSFLLRFREACCLVLEIAEWEALILSLSDTVRGVGIPRPKFHIHTFTLYSFTAIPGVWLSVCTPVIYIC